MTADNDYIDQLASRLSESVLNLAKVGYADQFIANGIEAYRVGEESALINSESARIASEANQILARDFEYPSGRIMDPRFLSAVSLEQQKELTYLARECFRLGDNSEKCLQEAVCLAQIIQERGAALAFVAELQRLLHRQNETSETLLKLHQKGNLRIFVNLRGDSGRWLFGDRKGPYWPSEHADMTESQHALNRTMQPFSTDVVRRMLTQYFSKHLCPRTGAPGVYQVNTSRLPSAWDVTEDINLAVSKASSQSQMAKGQTAARAQFSTALRDAVSNAVDDAHNRLQI